ncbi:methylthioribulose 1-phosphate dehydratase [Roseomonas sp. BN140053]|uniref:methylthioribulose 1-phosphate dehydratase n=1 Tax=Roseomonas sp. BN140053 TaxID=3391898 RepID=UPI0039EC0FBB
MTEAEAAASILRAARRLDALGWVPATAGNISALLPEGRVAITRSGFHKGFLQAEQVMVVDLDGRAEDPALHPSAETLLHCGAYRRWPGTGAVLHGHSIAATVLSRLAGSSLRLQGYELLKAFPGLPTHDAAVEIPVLDNSQDIPALQREVERRWDALQDAGQPIPPGYLIRGHGVYVWGPDMDAALARLEGLEFMLACELATRQAGATHTGGSQA